MREPMKIAVRTWRQRETLLFRLRGGTLEASIHRLGPTMNSVIDSWNGTEITVAIGGQKLLSVTGRAIRIDDSGILLAKGGGQVFFPVTSILYLSCADEVGKKRIVRM